MQVLFATYGLTPDASVPADPVVSGTVYDLGQALRHGSCVSPAETMPHLSSMATMFPGEILPTGTPVGTGLERGKALLPVDILLKSNQNFWQIHNPYCLGAYST